MSSKPSSIPSPQSFSWKQLGQQIWEWRVVWLTAPAVTGIVLAIRFTGVLQSLEWATLDEFFRRRPLEPIDSAIVIVEINEADIQATGQWPASDAVLTNLLQTIKQHQPRAIGLDLYRNLPVEPGHDQLVEFFKATPNLIGIEKVIGEENSPAVPPPPTLYELGQVASNDIVPDADGKIRRGLLILPRDEETWVEGLGLKLAQIYLEAQGITPDPDALQLQLGRATFMPFQPNDGGYVRADAGGYQILINFRGPARSFRTVSMTDVLNGRVPPDLMRDRLVFIGASAISLNDLFYTPYSSDWTESPERTPGVELQANIASQIIQSALADRPLIQVLPEPLEWLWIFSWAAGGATLGWTLNAARWATISILLAGSGMVIGCFLAFLGGWWIPVIPPAMALLGAAVVINRYVAIKERHDRQLVMNLFGRHVAPQVAATIWRDRQQILSEGRVQGQRLTATVLFTDLKDFSHLAESSDPESLMVWLNEYMGTMAQLVLDHDGIVDKFIGDSVMAVFGVPIPRTTPEAIAWDAQQAVKCALAMATKLETLNQQWQAEERPTATMRIGISTGTVIAGSLGGTNRLDYTTIGDSVNVAARLESYDKSSNSGICRILISEETHRLNQGQCNTCLIGEVTLRGRAQPVIVYQVLPAESKDSILTEP